MCRLPPKIGSPWSLRLSKPREINLYLVDGQLQPSPRSPQILILGARLSGAPTMQSHYPFRRNRRQPEGLGIDNSGQNPASRNSRQSGLTRGEGMRSSKNRVGEVLVLLACIWLAALPLLGADVNAVLSGTVKDTSGALVPGATITLTNTQTNISQTLKSASDGSYTFTNVPVGSYRLTVEQVGFRKYVQAGIVLQVNQAAKQDVSLRVGAAGEVVEVTENVSQVDTVTATLGSVETQKRIV